MKKLAVIMMIALIGLAGCTDTDAPAGPEVNENDTANEAVKIGEMLTAVAPYIEVHDDRVLSMMSSAERELDAEHLAFARQSVELNNAIIRDGAAKLAKTQQTVLLTPFFRGIADPCPPRLLDPTLFSSPEKAQKALERAGYHRTANYAGGSDRDYTLQVRHTGVPATKKVVNISQAERAYRYQAIIAPMNNVFRFNMQGPEPNPEIRSYQWPAWWWGLYTAWWHFNHC